MRPGSGGNGAVPLMGGSIHTPADIIEAVKEMLYEDPLSTHSPRDPQTIGRIKEEQHGLHPMIAI